MKIAFVVLLVSLLMLGCINIDLNKKVVESVKEKVKEVKEGALNETLESMNKTQSNESREINESEEVNETVNESMNEEEQSPEEIYLKVGGLTSQFTKNNEVSFFVQSENSDCLIYLNDEKIKDLPHFGIRASQNVIVQLSRENANNTIDVVCIRGNTITKWHLWVVWDTNKPYWKGNEITAEFEDGVLSISWPGASDLSPVTYHVRITYEYYD